MSTLSKIIKTIFLFASISPMPDLNNRKQGVWRICKDIDKSIANLWEKLEENVQKGPWRLREIMYKELGITRIALKTAYKATIENGCCPEPEETRAFCTLGRIDKQMQKMTLWIESHQIPLEPGIIPFINTDREREILAPFIRTITEDVEKDATRIEGTILHCLTHGKPISGLKWPTWKMKNDACEQITNLYTHAHAIDLNPGAIEIIMNKLLEQAKWKGNSIRNRARQLKKQDKNGKKAVPDISPRPLLNPAYIHTARPLSPAHVTPERPCAPVPANLPCPSFKDLQGPVLPPALREQPMLVGLYRTADVSRILLPCIPMPPLRLS